MSHARHTRRPRRGVRARLVAGALALGLVTAAAPMAALPAHAAPLPGVWCGPGESVTDLPDTVSGAQIHVVYAYGADLPDRSDFWAPRIVRDLAGVDEWWQRRGSDVHAPVRSRRLPVRLGLRPARHHDVPAAEPNRHVQRVGPDRGAQRTRPRHDEALRDRRDGQGLPRVPRPPRSGDRSRRVRDHAPVARARSRVPRTRWRSSSSVRNPRGAGWTPPQEPATAGRLARRRTSSCT